MTRDERPAADWIIVGLAALALPAGWLMGVLIVWLGPSMWELSVMRSYAVFVFGLAAPVAMTISAVWALMIRHHAWDAARRRFIFCLAMFPIIVIGYAFLIRWIELP